jgi:hypothetical protein
MSKSIQETLTPFIIEHGGDERLFNYVGVMVEAIELQDNELEEIRIQRDKAGNVVVATTLKLPNLRFRLGDLLLEATGSGMAIAGSVDQPLGLVLTGIRFLRAIRKLATLDVRKEDAEMLLAIFRLAQEEEVVRVDDLPALLTGDWDDASVAHSLERLEELACIEVGMDGIVLHETIIVQQID